MRPLVGYLRDLLLGDPGVEAIVGSQVYCLVLPKGAVYPAVRIESRPGVPGMAPDKAEAPLHEGSYTVDCLGATLEEAYDVYGAVSACIEADDRREVGGVVLLGLRQSSGPEEDVDGAGRYFYVSMDVDFGVCVD